MLFIVAGSIEFVPVVIYCWVPCSFRSDSLCKFLTLVICCFYVGLAAGYRIFAEVIKGGYVMFV